MNNPDTETTLSRRRLLRTTGAGIAGLTATSTLAGAQEDNDSGNGSDGSLRIQTRGLIPETDRVTSDDDYTSLFVQLTARLEELDAGAGDIDCSFMNWDPGETDIYEAQLIERVGTGSETIASQVYVPQDTDLTAGDLFIINNQRSCSGPYIGVQMENIRADGLDRGYTEVGSTGVEGGDSADEGGSSGAFGPGFGPLAAVGGLVGGAYALARRGDGDQ